jgi:hypothetical protein
MLTSSCIFLQVIVGAMYYHVDGYASWSKSIKYMRVNYIHISLCMTCEGMKHSDEKESAQLAGGLGALNNL